MTTSRVVLTIVIVGLLLCVGYGYLRVTATLTHHITAPIEAVGSIPQAT